MENIILYATDHGQTLRVNTYYSDIGSATSIKLKFKKLGATDTFELTATAVAGDTTTYAVDADIADSVIDSYAGTWIGQVETTFSDAILTGTTFILKIEDTPT